MTGWSLDRRKAEFAALDRVAYLDHARRGPVSARVVKTMTWMLEGTRLGSLGLEAQAEAIAVTRSKIAGMLGWPAESVAFVGNTTAAIAAFAQAVRWKPGDRVVTHEDEVGSNILPWQALAERGVEVQVLPSRSGRLDLEDLGEALRSGRVRAVTLAAVALHTGERRDLQAIGKLTMAHGCLFCVDAAQALGALQLDLAYVDAVFASGRKWLLGPPDVGILAIRPEVEEDLCAPTAGDGSLGGEEGWRPGAGRFEGGALPAPLIAGLGAALDLHRELGLDWIESRVLALVSEVHERARSAGFEVLSPEGRGASGVVQLRVPRAPINLELQLRKAGVVARYQRRRLRVSPHFWNTPADLERLFGAVQECIAS